jgi:hypothetical protein
MAERPNKPKEPAKPFAEFLKDVPSASEAAAEESIPLTGVVMRSEKEGMFLLTTQEGQTLELNSADVTNYEVLQETGPQRLVRVDVSAKALGSGVGAIGGFRTMVSDYLTRKELIKDPLKDPIKDPTFDTLKELIKDPIRKEVAKDPINDPITRVENIFDPNPEIDPAMEAGLTPFIMATPHHASQAAVAMQPGAFKPVWFDPTRKELIFDTRKELVKDPLTDPITWVENIGTIQEQTFDPGIGNVVNPAVMAGAAAAQPQAATAARAMMPTQPFKPVISDPITRKEFIYDTYKESIKDPIWDTRKEVFETLVEGGGTIQEGIGEFDPGAVWNLPGMMF